MSKPSIVISSRWDQETGDWCGFYIQSNKAKKRWMPLPGHTIDTGKVYMNPVKRKGTKEYTTPVEVLDAAIRLQEETGEDIIIHGPVTHYRLTRNRFGTVKKLRARGYSVWGCIKIYKWLLSERYYLRTNYYMPMIENANNIRG